MTMIYNETKINLQKLGFEGFTPICTLLKNENPIPKVKGVYIILYPFENKPKFKSIGSGGHFKGKNPNVATEILENNWIKDEPIIYIGKAGSISGSATLHSRLKQYLNFGKGKPVGHWGGRYIWQLDLPEDLVICWKPTPDHDPSIIENYLIQKFKEGYNQRPFANLRD